MRSFSPTRDLCCGHSNRFHRAFVASGSAELSLSIEANSMSINEWLLAAPLPSMSIHLRTEKTAETQQSEKRTTTSLP